MVLTEDTEASTEALLLSTIIAEGVRLVVIEGPDSGSEHDLETGTAIVGKSSACDLVLTDASVSKQHLKIEIVAGGIRVRDLGSKNGTSYLQSKLTDAVLAHGAVLKLGRTRLSLTSRHAAVGTFYSNRENYGSIKGASPSQRRLYALLERLEQSEHTVLIQGETGVGKDLVAREIHRHSGRRQEPYEVLDCGAISQNLIESELFGHVRGAFTGTSGDHAGVFERAKGGTVFLDEVGELPLEQQPKLLRALENRQIRRVGGSRTLDLDVRIIAATNRPLADEVAAGHFREDLFFRLNVVVVKVPPLRERREDIPTLLQLFLEEQGGNLELSSDTIELFTSAYDWPGNVRELRNAIAQVVAIGTVPERLQQPGADRTPNRSMSFDPAESYSAAKRRVLEAFERDYLKTQLERADQNYAKAARQAGMDRSYFKRRLKKLGLIKVE